MQINVIGRSKDWPGKPGLMDDESVHFFELPRFGFNPLQIYKFFRRVKKGMILYWVVDENTSLGPFPLQVVLPMVRTIIKKPGGPAIVLKSKNNRSETWQNFADVVAGDRSHAEVMQEAYFQAECGHPKSIYREAMQKERIEWLREKSQGHILEIGCSTGFVLDYVGGGVGVDTDELRLRYAQATYPQSKFICADAANMPFGDRSFDTVMIPDILEHVEIAHAQKIVDEAVRVGKRLLITVPNAGKANYNKALVENPEHKWFPTTEIMKSMVGPQAQLSLSRFEDFIYVVKE